VITTLDVSREEPDFVCCPRAEPRRPDRSGCGRFAYPSGPAAGEFPKIPKEFNDPMISNLVRIAAVILGLSFVALAQANQPATTPAQPDAPSAAAAAPLKATGTRVGTINIEQAIFSPNEGQRDFQKLSEKFAPKQTELKNAADEIDSLQKQLNAQQDKLNDEARDKLVKQLESKKKSYDRATQDAQEEFQGQQGEIGNRILTKMAPLIVKYATDNGYGMILDTSQQWPRGPVIWYGPAVDITQPVVEAYNVQSGVPAPPAGGAKPGATGTKPAPTTGTPGTRPAAPATKPPATNPPKQ